MKTPIKIVLGLIVGTALLSGCALLSGSGPQKAPTKLEGAFFDTTTNTAPVLVTNIVLAPVTNAAGLVQEMPVATNVTRGLGTNYGFAPNATAATITAVAGGIGSIFGVGGIVSTVLTGLFAGYASIRSRKATALAGTLAQTVETARAVIQTTPQGTALNASLKSWMMEHQTDAGVIQGVATLIDNFVDPQAATGAATAILQSLTGTQTSGPIAPPTIGPLA